MFLDFQKNIFHCTFKKAPKCFIHPNSLEFLGKIYPLALIQHFKLNYNAVNDYNFPNVGANLKFFAYTLYCNSKF